MPVVDSGSFALLESEDRQHGTVQVWDALPTEWAMFWILFNALMHFHPAQRDALLVKILAALGRSVDTSSPHLSKRLVSLCVNQGIQMFELNDIVDRCVESHMSTVMKQSRSSFSLNSSD